MARWGNELIDANGYRLNVGIILANHLGKVFLGKRLNQNAWQFPQGGLDLQENLEEAVYRELWEEVGLTRDKVEIIGYTRQWLKYKLPKKLIRSTKPTCIGQKQKWFLLKLIGEDSDINLTANGKPEFDGWQWVNYWFALSQVIHFKREVYRRALKELAPVFFGLTTKGSPAKSLNNILES
jgi:putative (di)nucleoside polyphosphate hydrolase